MINKTKLSKAKLRTKSVPNVLVSELKQKQLKRILNLLIKIEEPPKRKIARRTTGAMSIYFLLLNTVLHITLSNIQYLVTFWTLQHLVLFHKSVSFCQYPSVSVSICQYLSVSVSICQIMANTFMTHRQMVILVTYLCHIILLPVLVTIACHLGLSLVPVTCACQLSLSPTIAINNGFETF